MGALRSLGALWDLKAQMQYKFKKLQYDASEREVHGGMHPLDLGLVP